MRQNILWSFLRNKERRMGIESFFIKIEIAAENDDRLNTILSDNVTAKILHPYKDSQKEITFVGAILSFWDTSRILYSCLNEIHDIAEIKTISCMAEKRSFNFASYIDFVEWLYRLYEEKIEYFSKTVLVSRCEVF